MQQGGAFKLSLAFLVILVSLHSDIHLHQDAQAVQIFDCGSCSGLVTARASWLPVLTRPRPPLARPGHSSSGASGILHSPLPLGRHQGMSRYTAAAAVMAQDRGRGIKRRHAIIAHRLGAVTTRSYGVGNTPEATAQHSAWERNQHNFTTIASMR